ncbi:hypothetical protein Tco_0657808 [Tanacetum coccineum]
MSSYNHFGCSWCGGPFNGGNCPSCSSVGSGNEFVYDPNPYSYNEVTDLLNQPPQYQSRDILMWNFVEETLIRASIVKQGTHPSLIRFPEIHYPPQATDTEMLQARENLMETIQAFLKEYDHIPPEEKCMALLLAEERFLKIKQVVEEEQNST